jgi:hypothetical protein
MSTQYKRLPAGGGCLHPVFLPLAFLLGVYVFRSASMPLSDFAGYYFGGRQLLQGHFMDAYDMEKLNFGIARAGYHDVFVSYAPFPPFTSLVFAPFVVFQAGTARLLFDCFSSLIFLFTLMRFRVFVRLGPMPMLAIPVIFFLPIVNNLYFGQSYLLLCALLLEGYMAYRRGRTWLSSLIWGLAVVFKIFPAVILFFLLLRKKYRQAAFLCVACGLLLLLSIIINGWAAWKYYLSNILPKVNNGELNDSFTFMFQSAFMFFKRLFVYDGLLNPHPVRDIPWLFGMLTGLFKALILSACIIFTLRKKEQDFDSFATWIMGSLLISPNGSSYSLVLLAIPLLALMARRTSTGVILVLVLLGVCWVPVYRLGNLPVVEQYPRLYLLLVFFGGFIGSLRPAWKLWTDLSIVFIGLYFAGYSRGSDGSVYFLPREEHIFIYDYGIRDRQLVYTCWEPDGAHAVATGFPVTDTAPLELRNNQIFYHGRQLTTTTDSKKKPMLINGSFILYLSDKNRGPGFYTLRKLTPAGGR